MSEKVNSIRILHVDDDPDLAELVSTYLRREDSHFEVVSAGSASDGLDTLAETDIDCVVSDYDMPERNGIELLEAVRERDADLPFILFTAKEARTSRAMRFRRALRIIYRRESAPISTPFWPIGSETSSTSGEPSGRPNGPSGALRRSPKTQATPSSPSTPRTRSSS
ncbi:hypothetical protein DJ79_08900 [Halorubrum ezzemoulense]|uniref:Response regulatory domain-containing protein n=1 Tax=Halorubrum ezzemoulense TaxID=337243 RepID=A0A256JG08_HALEZ|nr:response regulator [Halorubrum ezzemoulense]OYR67543.1 hypothetical protein DJ79_08900 [Halorubrum ezzemoulense]